MSVGSDIFDDFINKNSKFFTLPDDTEKIVKFLGVEKIPNRFDGGKSECLRYIFESNGVRQSWDRGSRILAEQMARYPFGSMVGIKKTGVGNQTKYFTRLIQE
ncbi:MAG TPA: hypothetical protein PL155_08505 [Candidatus Omnitrophota bacterium]|nr:hypothetical protein [Candidatus Omnitrophota bacterium]HPD85505.1 hypothetical protein [Candidatus Omnitrophota bacterium]HRZ03994.1 hypothetical protein [Candidatus Omnitrophota bacterium]